MPPSPDVRFDSVTWWHHDDGCGNADDAGCMLVTCYMHTGDTGDTCCCFASTYVDASAVGEPSQHFCCHVFCEDVCGGVLVSLVGTLCSDTTPPWMRSWMNMNLSWMCFARSDILCLAAIDFRAELSVWMRRLMRLVFRASMMKFLMYSASWAPVPLA